jgi:hypothetical protein
MSGAAAEITPGAKTCGRTAAPAAAERVEGERAARSKAAAAAQQVLRKLPPHRMALLAFPPWLRCRGYCFSSAVMRSSCAR